MAIIFATMLSLDLTGKNALVAGSTQGIGLAAAQALADLGCNCTLIARNQDSLELAVASLNSASGQKHSYLVADFSNPDQVKSVVGQVAGTKPFHILVNNTGGPPAGPIAAATPEQFLAAFNQHLICNHIIVSLLADGMKAAGYGRIVNVISTSVKIPLAGLGVSNTIRGAVASWAKTMANELASFGITVNNILPGATATGRLDTIISNKAGKTNAQREEIEADMIREIPAKRFGMPEEIAAVIAFLCTPAAAYVNGTSIPVDGGRTGSI